MLRIQCNDTTFGDIFYHEKGRGFDDWPEEFNQEVNKKRKLSELANEEIIGPVRPGSLPRTSTSTESQTSLTTPRH